MDWFSFLVGALLSGLLWVLLGMGIADKEINDRYYCASSIVVDNKAVCQTWSRKEGK